MPSPDARPNEVVVIGGGLIGASIAWRLAAAGMGVTVVVGERSAAASRVAAGMLAPVSEAAFTEKALVPLNLASLDRYESFAAEVEEASGLPAGLSRQPTISVADDADDVARLRTLSDFLVRSGLGCEPLTSREAKSYEPLLAPSIRAGLLVVRDWSCDNRLLLPAVVEAGRRAGVVERLGFAHGIRSTGDRATGVELANGDVLEADVVVVANGAWAGQLTGLRAVPVRPVKGQILRLDPGRNPSLQLTVRAFTRGAEVYLVPRPSGREVVVGATVEERGFERQATAGGLYELLRDARAAVPMTAEYGLAEVSVGWRPGTPDNAPILGRGELDGLFLATGHYRNGVLLTPITADVMARLVTTGELDPIAEPFGPERFQREPAPAVRKA